MMPIKHAFIILTLFLTTSLFATEPINLVDENMSIEMPGSSTTFQVIRTSETPKKVAINVQYDKAYIYCAEHGSRQVWVPPTSEYVCEPDHEECHQVNGRRICEMVDGRCYYEHTPGHYETETFCERHETGYRDVSKTVKLNFRKACKLSGNDSEQFEVTIVQPDAYRKKLGMSGKVMNATCEYEIESKDSIFTYLNLYFKKKK